MKYIYESPDNGNTIYRTPMGVPHAKRELITSPLFNDTEKLLELIISDDGVVVINDFEKGNQNEDDKRKCN